MVLMEKKAVGAEYAFPYQHGFPREEKQTVIRRRLKISPVFRVVLGFLLISCFFLTALGFTYVKAKAAHLNWELSQIKQENIAIAGNMEKMKLEIASFQSLDRIKDIAVNELGMSESPRIEYLVLNNVFVEDEEVQREIGQTGKQVGEQLAAGKKNSIFKIICEVIAAQELMDKG